MPRIVYVNGAYMPESDAKISVFDRGFLMADAVYEVTAVIGGKLIDYAGHIQRLHRSLKKLDMAEPCTEGELLNIHRHMVEKNALDQGLIYMQVTRGVADRNFIFPPSSTKPSLVLFTQTKKLRLAHNEIEPLSIISIDDLRWARRDIKTVQLLYPSMAKMLARKQGADDAWMVQDGYVTEGTSYNAHIICGQEIITRPLSNDILSGITRKAILDLAQKAGLTINERLFSIDEAKTADEAFITSATSFVQPVVKIDGHIIGDGKMGKWSYKLHQIYVQKSLEKAI